MPNTNCYGCGALLTDQNRSTEHVINNCIGGHLKSRNVLCDACNNRFSDSIDKDVEDQLGNLADLLGIKKDREKKRVKIPLKATDGSIKYVGKQMKPHDKIRATINGTEKFEVFTETTEEYETLKKERITQLEKRFTLKSEETIEQPTTEKYFIQNANAEPPDIIGFGGLNYFRGLAKIAVNYYLSRGYDADGLDSTIAFINGNNNNNKTVNYYYPSSYQVHNLKADEVSHIIYIVGDPECKMLFAYIELFSFENVIVILNPNYNGPELEDTYCYDVIGGVIVKDKSIKIELGCHHFEVLPIIARAHLANHEKMFQRFEMILERTNCVRN